MYFVLANKSVLTMENKKLTFESYCKKKMNKGTAAAFRVILSLPAHCFVFTIYSIK